MIEALTLTKAYGRTTALNRIGLTIEDGEIFGLVGTNGAGKSTLLRLIAGVLRPTEGSVTLDARPVYDNPAVKREIFFVPDEAYFFTNSTPLEMMRYYAMMYPSFDEMHCLKLLGSFSLDPRRKIAEFSKGMKKQLFICLGVAAHVRYLLLDETFDGLDPIARQGAKSIFAGQMADESLTIVIASHSLRELEDICDHVGLLHEGGVLLSRDVESMKLGLQKVQCVFASEEEADKVLADAEVLVHDVRGRLHTITLRGTREETQARLDRAQTVFTEMLTLSLEEVFISETEAAGYDVKKFILD
ncbi:MAG: ABC transporter ATP-binding protein [Lachnospiraceae bacterium]|nr:ABC transporter ATP-binding protein [Lachnospiraceae bacterium]